MSMLESDDDVLEFLESQTFASPFESEDIRCSLVGVDNLGGELVALGVEQYLEDGSTVGDVFLQFGEGAATVERVLVPTLGMSIGLLTDERNGIIIVASASPAARPDSYQDLYLHAYSRSSDELLWEQTFENLIGLDESFYYAGMVISDGILTLTGSTSGLPNVSTSSTPMNKSMMSFTRDLHPSFLFKCIYKRGHRLIHYYLSPGNGSTEPTL